VAIKMGNNVTDRCFCSKSLLKKTSNKQASFTDQHVSNKSKNHLKK